MNLKWRTPPQQFLDQVELARVDKTMAMLGLDSGTAIDSYKMTPDGPKPSSIFIVSGDFLIETQLTTPDISFDVALSGALVNYRVTLGTLTQPVPPSQPIAAEEVPGTPSQPSGAIPPPAEQAPPQPVRTRFAEVGLRHTDQMHSGLSYFGEDLESWLAFVFEAYPVQLLKKTGL